MPSVAKKIIEGKEKAEHALGSGCYNSNSSQSKRYNSTTIGSFQSPIKNGAHSSSIVLQFFLEVGAMLVVLPETVPADGTTEGVMALAFVVGTVLAPSELSDSGSSVGGFVLTGVSAVRMGNGALAVGLGNEVGESASVRTGGGAIGEGETGGSGDVGGEESDTGVVGLVGTLLMHPDSSSPTQLPSSRFEQS